MTCKDCQYFWADCNEQGEPIENEHCHYQWDDGYAPCEVSDEDGGEEYDEWD